MSTEDLTGNNTVGTIADAQSTTKTEKVKRFFMLDYNGESHRDIARILDVSTGTVSRGRQAAEALGWEEPHPETSAEKEIVFRYPDGRIYRLEMWTTPGRLTNEQWSNAIREAHGHVAFEGDLEEFYRRVFIADETETNITFSSETGTFTKSEYWEMMRIAELDLRENNREADVYRLELNEQPEEIIRWLEGNQ